MIWGGLRDLGSSEPNQCKPNQSTYRQPLPKVYVQQFDGQGEDWFGIFRALLVYFGLGIMHEEGICPIWIFGFLRSKSSNLEVWKKWGVDVEMSPYLFGKKKYIDEMQYIFDFWKCLHGFLCRAKVRVKNHFLGNSFSQYIDCCETMYKNSIWSNLFHLHVCQMSFQVVNVEWKK